MSWLSCLLVFPGCSDPHQSTGFSHQDNETGIGPFLPDSSASDSANSDTGDPITGDPWESPPVPPELSDDALSEIHDEIQEVIAMTTATVGIYIVDAENEQVIFAHNEEELFTPASNNKLFTTAVAYDLFGGDYPLGIHAYGSEQPSNGTVDEVDIVMGHDWTWSTDFHSVSDQPAQWVAADLYAVGVRHIGSLTVRGEVLVDGYQFGSFNASAHRSEALELLEDAFVEQGIVVDNTSPGVGFVPIVNILLSETLTPPLSTIGQVINDISHNEMADILLRHNGHEIIGDSSYAGGESVAIEWLDSHDLSTFGMAFDDGSGLSYANQVTPTSVVELQRVMAQSDAGSAWLGSFSVAGYHGTLAYRMQEENTLGRFWGKTGTLNSVICTSGTLFHRLDGHRYWISILFNNVSSQSQSRALQDNIIAVIAGDHRAQGEAPGTPVLQQTIAHEDGSITIDWTTTENTQGYLAWFSDDGVVWNRQHAQFVQSSPYTVVGHSGRKYIRLTAVNEAGESAPSDVFAVTGGAQSNVLIVDGNDRWDGQWENPREWGHDFVVDTAASAPQLAVDTVANEVLTAGLVDLMDYDAVIWILGEESTEHLTFDAPERALVDEYLESGGNLMVSGAEIGWDLDEMGNQDSRGFYEDTLNTSYLEDNANTYRIQGVESGLFAGIGRFGFYTPAKMTIEYPDVLAPLNGAVAVLYYEGGTQGAAALSYEGSYRSVVYGFPFESIDSLWVRSELMERTIQFFGL